MPQPNHPTVADISAALAEQGITPPSGLDRIRAAVIAEWDRLTCYKPFLGASIESTFTYDPPYKIKGFELDLLGGFWQISSVKTGVTAYSTGTTLTQGTHYDVIPLNGDDEDRGWGKIRFRGHPGFEPASIEIIGKRGFAEQLPDDVFDAELEEMCRRAEEKVATSTGNVTEVKQGPVTLKFEKSASRFEGADKRFKRLARSYMRL
jgi:hypothetical protein